jgi:hypothetical protein
MHAHATTSKSKQKLIQKSFFHSQHILARIATALHEQWALQVVSRQRIRKRNLTIFIQKNGVSLLLLLLLLLLIARKNKPWKLPGITGISFFVHSIYSALM